MITKSNTDKTMTDILKELSEMDFLTLGREEIAYMRTIMVDGEKAIELKAADGTSLSVVDTKDVAIAMARQQDLKPVVVH